MAHAHSHSHAPVAGHAGARHRWRLAVAFGLVGTFFVIELVAAIASGSLALLSDAGHMGADVVALGAALIATRVAMTTVAGGRRTFGSYRIEVFASGLAVLLMLGVAVLVVTEAIGRLGEPTEVATGTMLVVGLLGLIVNIVTLALLRAGAAESLNVKGAYLEVVADTAGSVGVLAAGALVLATGQPVWDTVIALAIGAFVAVRAVLLGREVLAVLAQHSPIDPHVVEASLANIDGVEAVHDLHIWTLTSGMPVASAHVRADRDVLSDATALMRDEFGLEHVTLQVERTTAPDCDHPAW